jgi:hypothetical protein
MNRTVYMSLALAATTCTLVSAFFVQPPQAAARTSTSPDFGLRPIAASGNLLCGLSLGDVADIIDYYDFNPDMQALADALSTPFDCEAYGELCAEVDPADAYEFVCGTWDDMRMATPLPNLLDGIHVRLDELGIGTCRPTDQNCAIYCNGAGFITCTGWSFNGHCYPSPECADGSGDFPIFGDILQHQ